MSPSNLVIGYEADFAPLTFLDGGKSCGLVVDLLREAFGRIDVSAQFVPVPLAEQDAAVQAGNIGAVAFKAIIAERAGVYDFSLPVATSGAAWFVLQPRSAEPYAPDAAARIATPGKGPLIAQLQRNFPEAIFPEIQTYSEALIAVRDGAADCAALNFHVGRYLAKRDHPGQFVLPETPYLKTPLGVAFARGQNEELRNRFNTVIGEMQAGGTAAVIESKWLAK